MSHHLPQAWTPDERTLVVRHLAGDTSGAEEEQACALLRAIPAPAIAIDVLKAEQPTVTDEDVCRSWRAIEHRVGMSSTGSAVSRPSFRQNSTWGTGTRQRVLGFTAASAVLGIFVALVSWTVGVRHGGQSMASMSTYTTERGQRANITLPDGSTVSLGVASRLDVPANYGAGHHTVRVVGEALFTVSHRDRTPFTVTVGGTAVRVLGTSFVVRKYATDSATLVAVRDGKVAVHSVVVAAQQQIEVGRHGIGSVQPADPAHFSFTTGILTLERVSLSSAIEELNRWYDVDIRLGDPALNTLPITARLRAGSLADLTTLLTSVFDVRIVRNGRVLTIFPR